ncbi:glycoside hydrolase family 95-like protein [Chitinophaga sp. YIM B06452]|uniref:glycosyl hydrolase family 95 catalytic domain-containing protein n=1 Tax=Chitinophaga sp. YIM B06452 TaxID=3082158 RepID=UPI0031FE853C
MKKLILPLMAVIAGFPAFAQLKPSHNLVFPALASRWDEAIPLGNGMLGALVWQKAGRLRLSLDRVDLWDERPVLDLKKYSYQWVEQRVLAKQYDTVQRAMDEPYEAIPWPTKLPGAGLEFSLENLGSVTRNELDLASALNTITFSSGVTAHFYVHASRQTGYFSFENLGTEAFLPELTVPGYNTGRQRGNSNSVEGLGLEKLGYPAGTITRTATSVHYRQPTAQGKYYEVKVNWKRFPGNKVIGQWTISNNKPAQLPELNTALKEPTGWDSHIAWWKRFWSKSAVSLPDTLLEKQYYRDMYKLGAAARKGAPAISLQAVWTADNGNLPPWKGDFHNDLNTQLSYWPAYTGNHLQEAETFTDWLWNIRPASRQMTEDYFKVKGLNVPGVATITGIPMGGWIQYSLSPSSGAWVSQHMYWQWKYSMNKQLLQTRVYPWLQESAAFLENITRQVNGVRRLPLSSSPEYHDNSIRAWFTDWTNYDLSLAHFLFGAASETSKAMGKPAEAAHWDAVRKQLPALDVDEYGLSVAPGERLDGSHRHFSQYMAIYPLALLQVGKAEDAEIIKRSLRRIEEKGTRAWVGYSFAWMACIYARAKEADSAVKHLRIFASNFVSANSFHLNGDQKGGQYSSFTYRPFTLEGNFAFAQGVHELLMQQQGDVLEIFPALPASWEKVSFTDLRAEGAYLVSASVVNGKPASVKVHAEKGGVLRIRLPFTPKGRESSLVELKLLPGQTVSFTNP